MIDLLTESAISLTEAAHLLPRGRRGRPVTLSCVLRWVLDGVRVPSGDRVRLEALRLGGRWITSKEAIQRFAERLTPKLDGSTLQSRTPAAAKRRTEAAQKKLERHGI